MDSRLNAFLERADAVLARLEPLLPAPRQAIDWSHCLAARWQREGRGGFLLPLEVSLDMRLSDLIGIDQQRALAHVPPLECQSLLRSQPGVGEHRDQGGVRRRGHGRGIQGRRQVSHQ